MRDDLVLKVKALIQSYLEKDGYVLVDIRFTRNQHGENIFEILVDRAEGGITLQECGRMAAALGEVLDAEGDLSFSYTLDVSSPGVDRPLATVSDFRRVIGRTVRFFLKEPLNGKSEVCGIVEGTDAESVTINTKNIVIQIPLAAIHKAKQVIV